MAAVALIRSVCGAWWSCPLNPPPENRPLYEILVWMWAGWSLYKLDELRTVVSRTGWNYSVSVLGIFCRLISGGKRKESREEPLGLSAAWRPRCVRLQVICPSLALFWLLPDNVTSVCNKDLRWLYQMVLYIVLLWNFCYVDLLYLEILIFKHLGFF